MSADLVNGLFELVGSLFTWMNYSRVCRDKGYAGVYLPAIIFFMSWGLWNVYYYPSLHQWFSLGGGLCLVAANIAWVGSMVWYGRKR